MVNFAGPFSKDGAQWLWNRMSRTKTLATDIMETPLKRCLTTVDITLLGIGHMVGAGIYVLTGTVAKDVAGPAIVVSFLLAGFVSILSALCYAEFGARVPKAGSAYVYTYVTMGEFWSFIIGWNIILEHMIGAASVSRAWSGYMRSLLHGVFNTSVIAQTSNATYFDTSSFSSFTSNFDVLAFTVTLVYCGFLALGVKGSAYFNSVFTLINMCVMAFIVVVGPFGSDIKNWQTSGGFAPYGLSGIVAGAATCFYAFVGFDSIATSSEEALNPRRSIPIATITSMMIVTVGYVLIGAVLTLMVPYYELNPASAIPDAFEAIGLNWAKYVISIGALCGMTTSLFGSLFSLPRCVYAMASDGLLFSWLAKVSDKTQVPVLNMALCGVITAVIALLFDLEKLVEFMSIGTLMAYTLVSASVVILRYRKTHSPKPSADQLELADSEMPQTPKETSALEETRKIEKEIEAEDEWQEGKIQPCLKWLVRCIPPSLEDVLVPLSLWVFFVASIGLTSLIQWGFKFLENPIAPWAAFLVVLFTAIILVCTFVIVGHRQVEHDLAFKVPLVPYIPLLSIFWNIFLMVHLNPMTWIRFAIWLSIGILLYFCYGIHHSKEKEPLSAYSTLIGDPAGEPGETVFDAVQQKLSQVTSRIISTASDAVKDGGASQETQTIIDKEITQE